MRAETSSPSSIRPILVNGHRYCQVTQRRLSESLLALFSFMSLLTISSCVCLRFYVHSCLPSKMMRIPVYPYYDPLSEMGVWGKQHQVKILCLGMDFTNPVNTPRKTDDIRLRMLGYICPGATIKSIGQDPVESSTHRRSDVRTFPADIVNYLKAANCRGRRCTRGSSTNTWFFDAIHSDVIILDYYWMQTTYFESGPVHGFGIICKCQAL